MDETDQVLREFDSELVIQVTQLAESYATEILDARRVMTREWLVRKLILLQLFARKQEQVLINDLLLKQRRDNEKTD